MSVRPSAAVRSGRQIRPGAVTALLGRVGAMFFEQAESTAPIRCAQPPASAVAPVLAAVVGAPAAVVPIAASCAGELRARGHAAAALVCIWRPVDVRAPDPEAPAARSPAGATTPGARRLAARLTAEGLTATACGRLGWLSLDHDPAAAAAQFLRARVFSDIPLVLAVAGARPASFEPLLADADLCLAVLPADIDPTLRELAIAGLPARTSATLPPLPPGPPRWAAMAGLARLRSLPELKR